MTTVREFFALALLLAADVTFGSPCGGCGRRVRDRDLVPHWPACSARRVPSNY